MTGPIGADDGLPMHSQTLRRLAQRVAVGWDAARTVHLDRMAYGVMCQWLVEFFEPGGEIIIGGLTSSVTNLTWLSAFVQEQAVQLSAVNAEAEQAVVAPLRLPL